MVSSVSNSDGTLTISPTTGIVVASIALGHANTWTAAQTFTASDFILKGSSTGVTTLNSGLSGAGNNTLTLPITTTDTLAGLGTVQTFSAAQTFGAITTTAGSAIGITAKSSGSPYTVLSTDEFIVVTTGGSGYTVDLPAASANAGRKIIIVKADSGAGAVTVTPAGADTIEGSATKSLTTQVQ